MSSIGIAAVADAIGAVLTKALDVIPLGGGGT
jgi:hypothetical protein